MTRPAYCQRPHLSPQPLRPRRPRLLRPPTQVNSPPPAPPRPPTVITFRGHATTTSIHRQTAPPQTCHPQQSKSNQVSSRKCILNELENYQAYSGELRYFTIIWIKLLKWAFLFISACMHAPYVWDHISEGKACIKNPKTCGPSKWPPLTTGMSYSCGQSVSFEKPRDKRLPYKLVDWG